ALGLCAILIAAVAVSVGVVPEVPLLSASPRSVVHAVEPGPVELMHAARIFASVSISFCGTVPLPAGVVASAAPVLSVSRLGTAANALATPVAASVVLELEMCVASVA